MAQGRVIPIVAARPPVAAGADDGWRRLTTLAEPRLTEMAENYRALGYEVEVREVERAPDGGCDTCLDAGQAMGRTYGTLYVRREGAAPAADPLFD